MISNRMRRIRLPAWSDSRVGGFLAAFADGHVQMISQSAPVEAIKALFTRNGGEAVDPARSASSQGGRVSPRLAFASRRDPSTLLAVSMIRFA